MNFAFAFEPKEPNLMKRDPREADSRNILTASIKKLILIVGIITGILSILIYLLLLKFGLPIEEVRTIMFAVLAIDPIFFAFSFKSLKSPVWKINIFSNRYLLLSLVVSLVLLFGALAFEPLRELLRLTPLSLNEFGLLAGIGVLNLFIIEVTKHFIFRPKAEKFD